MDEETKILLKLQELSIKYQWETLFPNTITNIDDIGEGSIDARKEMIIYDIFDDSPVKNAPNLSNDSLIPTISSTLTKEVRVKSLKAATTTPKSFSRIKESLSSHYYKEFNEVGFRNQLPLDLTIVWNKRMTKTAGVTKMRKYNLSDNPRTALIELSTKVVDNEEKLKQTLAHEMCHVATWLLDGISEPHGSHFWKWAKQVENTVSGITVTRCHSYEIHAPFKFICTNEDCQHLYSRHTKKGIDINKHLCGLCQSPLEFYGAYNQDGTPKKIREPSGFSLFVQQNYHQVKTKYELSQQKEIMSKLSELYQQTRRQELQPTELFPALVDDKNDNDNDNSTIDDEDKDILISDSQPTFDDLDENEEEDDDERENESFAGNNQSISTPGEVFYLE